MMTLATQIVRRPPGGILMLRWLMASPSLSRPVWSRLRSAPRPIDLVSGYRDRDTGENSVRRLEVAGRAARPSTRREARDPYSAVGRRKLPGEALVAPSDVPAARLPYRSPGAIRSTLRAPRRHRPRCRHAARTDRRPPNRSRVHPPPGSAGRPPLRPTAPTQLEEPERIGASAARSTSVP